MNENPTALSMMPSESFLVHFFSNLRSKNPPWVSFLILLPFLFNNTAGNLTCNAIGLFSLTVHSIFRQLGEKKKIIFKICSKSEIYHRKSCLFPFWQSTNWLLWGMSLLQAFGEHTNSFPSLSNVNLFKDTIRTFFILTHKLRLNNSRILAFQLDFTTQWFAEISKSGRKLLFLTYLVMWTLK